MSAKERNEVDDLITRLCRKGERHPAMMYGMAQSRFYVGR